MLALSATRCPVYAPTEAERRAAALRAARANGRPKTAVLLHDPSGDFQRGMAVSPPEIAYGLKERAWAVGTRFRLRGQVVTVRADGRLRDRRGHLVIVLPSLGH